MREYNDYVNLTRRYLKSYKQLQITVKNLDDEIAAQEMELKGESVAIAHYGDNNVRGTSELNATEAAANRRIKIEHSISAMKKDKEEIERLLRKINRALEGLNEADKTLVIGYYIDGYSWQQLAQQNYCSEKWTRDKGNKALKEVAFMVFGRVVKPQQLKFVFVV